MANELSVERLQTMTTNLVDSLTSEEFLSRLREVRTAPDGERLKRASDLLSVDGLRRSGVAMPSTMRITSRFFEDAGPASPSTLIADMDAIDPAFLPALKQTHPDIHEKLTQMASQGTLPAAHVVHVTGQITTYGVCAGGGASGTCACAGQP